MKKTMVTWREVGRVIARLSKMTKKGSEGGVNREKGDVCVQRFEREREWKRVWVCVCVCVSVSVCERER